MSDSEGCKSCGLKWEHHPGIEGVCLQKNRIESSLEEALKLLRVAERRLANVDGKTVLVQRLKDFVKNKLHRSSTAKNGESK